MCVGFSQSADFMRLASVGTATWRTWFNRSGPLRWYPHRSSHLPTVLYVQQVSAFFALFTVFFTRNIFIILQHYTVICLEKSWSVRRAVDRRVQYRVVPCRAVRAAVWSLRKSYKVRKWLPIRAQWKTFIIRTLPPPPLPQLRQSGTMNCAGVGRKGLLNIPGTYIVTFTVVVDARLLWETN